MKKKDKIELLAISIEKGIITLLEQDNSIAFYRQRNIDNIDDTLKMLLINKGLLDCRWHTFKEIPLNYKIHFEAPEIQGRARESFPNPNMLLMHN